MQLHYLMFGAFFATDVVGVAGANQGDKYNVVDASGKTVNEFDDVKQQWTLAFNLGAAF